MKKKVKKEAKYIIPKGFKVWRKVSIYPYGSFALFAYRKDKVAIFNFDGIEKMPTEVFNYQTLKI